MDFTFNIGDEVKDTITGFKGIVTARTQWLNNCNTYGVQPTKLKDGAPQAVIYFDQPQLELVKKKKVKASKKKTGGPERRVPAANR